MTTFVLVHGSWHGPWAWDRVVMLLHAAGARTLTPDLSTAGDYGLHDHAQMVIAALDNAAEDDIVLVGHSYAGLVVREAADARPDTVGRIVLVDGWAGPDGSSMFSLAPDSFVAAVRAAAETLAGGYRTRPHHQQRSASTTQARQPSWPRAWSRSRSARSRTPPA